MKLFIILGLTFILAGCQGTPSQSPTPGTTAQSGHEETDEHGHEHGEAEHGESELQLSDAQIQELGVQIGEVTAAETASTGVRPGRIVADPDGKVLLSSQVTGTLSRFYVQIGANVSQGQVVAEIRSPEVTSLQAEFHEAEVEAELAGKELSNTRSLLQVGDDVQRPLETAKLELGQAVAERDAAAAKLKSIALKNDRLETLLTEGIASRQQVEESRAERQAMKAELAQAEAAVEIAKNHVDRESKVSDSRLREKAETFPAEARLARASESMRHAQERLSQLGASPHEHDGLVTLRSPIAGQVVERPLTVGELVQGGQSVASVVDTAKLWVLVDLQRSDLDLVKVGDSISLSLVEQPEVTQSGKLDYLAPQLEESTQTVEARVVLNNPDSRFRLGSFVNARVSAGASVSSPAVPQEAVQFVRGETVVYLRDEHGFERKPVTLGPAADSTRVCVTGVKVGDRIVVRGAEQLKSMDLAEDIGGHSH